jgi:DNA invertase Pin-like site-specific DNA recombinase
MQDDHDGFAGIAEFEQDLIRERTGAGREAAEQRGVRFGRPCKLNTDQAQVARGRQGGSRYCKTFNVHEATIYRLAAARDSVLERALRPLATIRCDQAI